MDTPKRSWTLSGSRSLTNCRNRVATRRRTLSMSRYETWSSRPRDGARSTTNALPLIMTSASWSCAAQACCLISTRKVAMSRTRDSYPARPQRLLHLLVLEDADGQESQLARLAQQAPDPAEKQRDGGKIGDLVIEQIRDGRVGLRETAAGLQPLHELPTLRRALAVMSASAGLGLEGRVVRAPSEKYLGLLAKTRLRPSRLARYSAASAEAMRSLLVDHRRGRWPRRRRSGTRFSAAGSRDWRRRVPRHGS